MKPHVSAVMPTGDRHKYIPGAIACFLSQTFDDSELVILDDGKEPCVGLIPDNPRIRYVYKNPYGGRHTIGAKRNMVNALAQGTVLVHFDDDDWSAPDRIANQLGFMEMSHSRVVGYHTMLYWREADQRGFMYNEPSYRPNAGGTSLCYTRAWWEKHPFIDKQVGEDFFFCVTARRDCTFKSDDVGQRMVARVHPGGSCRPVMGSELFPEIPRERFPQAFFE